MHYTSRKLHLVQPYMLDTATRGPILNGCWLLAAAGISIVQMRLLSEAWHQNQHAAPTACVASVWLIGALIGTGLHNALLSKLAPPREATPRATTARLGARGLSVPSPRPH